MNKTLIRAVSLHPEVLPFLDLSTRAAYYKAAPMTRDELERKIARMILSVDRVYLSLLENGGPRNVPFGFWADYTEDIRKQIAAPMRQYIEQSFTNYSDYVNFVDRTGAVMDIDTAMTRAITESAQGITQTTQKQLQAMLADGITDEEIIERIALRFSSGHAEQVAVTEITRAEGYFSEALQSRLSEQGVEATIRWVTAEDEKVCPICAPLDDKIKPPGGWNAGKFGTLQGPPAHPNCRCKTVVELKK